MDNGALFIIALFIFGGGAITKMFSDWNQARVQIAKLKYQDTDSSGNAALRVEMEAMRTQIASLRDTTTQYDLSFDTSLQRMEQRMAHLEQRLNATASERDSVAVRY